MRPTYILGINSAYHEPSACLIKDGHVVAAAEEERFTRVRHGKPADLQNPHELPEQSIRYCLAAAGITAEELDHIGFSFVPEKRLNHNIGLDEETAPGTAGSPEAEKQFQELLLTVPAVLSRMLGTDVTGRFRWIEHHICHAASAFFVSPFDEAAVMSIDGIGEATTAWFGMGRGNRLEVLKETLYPNSLGLLWTKMSRFLGFGEYGQWKVMGLAGYGDADRYYPALRSFVTFDAEGNLTVDPRVLQLRVDRFDAFEALFGPRRNPADEVDDRHQDLAAALQRLTTEALLAFASFLKRATGARNLCLAGGVALNCVANRALIEEGPFEGVFIQPAANDAGTALGACFVIWNQILGKPRGPALEHVFLGPKFGRSAVEKALGRAEGCMARWIGGSRAAEEAARLIADGEIVAWFQDRMEFGPRALGNRSLLADPRRADIVHTINDRVKHREYFRPFAGSVLSEKATEWFDIPAPSAADDYMLCARRVRSEKVGSIPAVTHVDGTCRLQRVDRAANPAFHQLLCEFEKLTGVPVVLNTSFNDREPIICTPEDALATCLKAGIRHLFIGGLLVDLAAEDAREEGFGAVIARAIRHLGEVLEIPVLQPFMSR